jgi:beta-xylosidase
VRRHRKPINIRGQKSFAPPTSDEFDLPKLGLQWQWHANHRDDWHSLVARPGWLRLFPQLETNPLNEQPNLLLQKFPARSFTVETELQLSPAQSGEEAGLIMVGEKSAAVGVLRAGLENWLVLRTDDKLEKLRRVTSQPVKLRVIVRAGGEFSFGFAGAGEFVAIPHSFQAVKGKWIGAKLGLYSLKPDNKSSAGHADFDCFRYL